MYKGTVLIVDDEPLIRWSVRQAIEQSGHTAFEAENGSSAISIAQREDLSLAMIDLKLPDMTGIDVMKQVLQVQPNIAVIIMTAYSSVETAVEAMKLGAFDYVCKPFNIEELVLTAGRAIETVSMRKEIGAIKSSLKANNAANNLIGKSPAIEQLRKLIVRIAQSEANTILIRGESGVGKDVVARAIHFESKRAYKPFMNITCTALQDTLLESELFGHEKGAFTDAKSQKKGLIELADGGTVYLDEIGDMSINLQAKLLRFLEDKTFRRVGGTTDLRVDVKVIAATNRDLTKAMMEGKFREDLFYRLNIIPLSIPPLRERTEDIPLLTQYFAELFSASFKKSVRSISRDAMQLLVQHPWPGNVRELRNAIERAVLLCEAETIQPTDLLIQSSKADKDHVFALPPGGVAIDEVERILVIQALERTNWDKSKAARLLGISRDQLNYRVKKFNLSATSTTRNCGGSATGGQHPAANTQ